MRRAWTGFFDQLFRKQKYTVGYVGIDSVDFVIVGVEMLQLEGYIIGQLSAVSVTTSTTS
jgi:hypothetical protein